MSSDGRLTKLLGNGFANRFLFCLAKRSKLLPTGGKLTDETLQPLRQRVYEARKFASTVSRMQFNAEAEAYWCEVYAHLSEGKPDLIGAGFYRRRGARMSRERVGTSFFTDEEILTRDEVAAWLKVKPRQVERLGVPCIDLGRKTKRYRLSDVVGWLEEHRNS